MSWWQALLERARHGPFAAERKSVIFNGLPSRQDGINFRTNTVTLADYDDAMAGSAVRATGHAATWACTGLIAGTGSTLPCVVYRTVDRVRQVAREHPLFYVLHESPNADQTAVDFFEFMFASIELMGNAYAEVARREDGSVISLTPIRPDWVKVERRAGGALEYSWYDGTERHVRASRDVLHIRGPMGNPLGGVSVLTACRAVFAGAMSAEQAARNTFANGIQSTGVLSIKEPLTPELRAEAQEALEEKYAGTVNRGKPLVLDNGVTWTAISITPEDAQMLESRKFSGEEICRLFGVPPAMVGYGDKASNWGTGKEVDVLGFLKFTMRRRIKRIEQALKKQLLTPADRAAGVTIEFNMEGLLRGDSAGRSAFYQQMTQMGAMTINEVRQLENLPPVPGGDVPRLQMQNVPITEAGQEVS